MRHAVTTPGVGDPPGFRLDDCSTQRNLTDSGRQDAKRVGAAFRARGIAVERVLTSPWCRCIETANLAFGKAETSTALSNLFTHPENRDRQVREMKQLVDAPKAGNRVLVSHGATISGADRCFAGYRRDVGRHAAAARRICCPRASVSAAVSFACRTEDG